MEWPIVYLQNKDFDENGRLIEPSLKNKIVLVLIQINGCVYCEKAKPTFQQAANLNKDSNVVFAAIQADGNFEDEPLLKERLVEIIPFVIGFPSFAIFVNGKLRKDDGLKDRSLEGYKNFIYGRTSRV